MKKITWKRACAHVAALLQLFLLAAGACGGRRAALEAPPGAARGPVSLWSAVTSRSSIVFHARLDPLLEVPLVRGALDLVRGEVVGKNEEQYTSFVRELGFDPLYDISELFFTDLGDPGEGFVLLARYRKEADLLSAASRIFSGLLKGRYAISFEKVDIRGRKAILNEKENFVALEVDPFTVAILKASREEAAGWLDQMSRPNGKRKEIHRRIEDLARDKALGGRLPAISLFVESSLPVSPGGRILDLVKGGEKWLALQAAVERDVFAVVEIEYNDADSARMEAEKLQKELETPPPAMAFFSEIFSEMRKGLKVDLKGPLLKVEIRLPESLLDAIYVMLKLFIDIGKSMDEGAAPGGDVPGVENAPPREGPRPES